MMNSNNTPTKPFNDEIKYDSSDQSNCNQTCDDPSSSIDAPQTPTESKEINEGKSEPQILMKGKLTHMKSYTFWWSTQNAILYDNDILILYDKDIKNGTEFNIKQDNCVAKINQDSDISFYLHYVNGSGEHEFKAENKEERSDWVLAINKTDPELLLEYMVIAAKYAPMIEQKNCQACGENNQLYFCAFPDCSRKDKLYCKECYEYLHNKGTCKHALNLEYREMFDLTTYDPYKKLKIKIIKSFKRLYKNRQEPIKGALNTLVQHAFYIGIEQTQRSSQVLYHLPFLNPGVNLTIANIGIVSASIGMGVGALAVFTAMTVFDVTQYWRGKITLRELGRRSVRNFGITLGLSVASGIGVSASIGIQALLIGSASIGVTAGFGIGVGVVVALILGIIFAQKIKKKFDEWWPSDETKLKREMLRDALEAFGFTENTMKDPTQFNITELNKKYHSLAKKAHPDRNGGDHSKFIKLTEQYSILTAQYDLIDGNNNKNINKKGNEPPKSITM